MRRIVFLVAIIAATALGAHGQEAAQPTVDLTTNPPADQTPVPASPTTAQPPAAELPDLPELSQLDQAFKETSLGSKADASRMRIEWRRLRNRLANDPEVVAAKKASDTARTDFEKRERLRDYYRIYYARMEALASRPEIKSALEEMKKQHLKLADQKRVRPSPKPADEPSEADEAEAEEDEEPSLAPPATSPSPTPSPIEVEP